MIFVVGSERTKYEIDITIVEHFAIIGCHHLPTEIGSFDCLMEIGNAKAKEGVVSEKQSFEDRDRGSEPPVLGS